MKKKRDLRKENREEIYICRRVTFGNFLTKKEGERQKRGKREREKRKDLRMENEREKEIHGGKKEGSRNKERERVGEKERPRMEGNKNKRGGGGTFGEFEGKATLGKVKLRGKDKWRRGYVWRRYISGEQMSTC